jgi:hypothetical protein
LVSDTDAAPLLFNVPVPKTVAPLWKVTVPVGTTVPEAGVTVAVSVSDDPNVTVLSDAAIVIVVEINGCAITVIEVAVVVALASKSVEPAKVAVINCVPSGNVLIPMTALPVSSRLAVPSTVAPLWKVTIPVGTALPEVGVTVAVRVSEFPTMTVLSDAASVVVVGVATTGAFTVTEVACVVELPAKFAEPAYEAVSNWVPTGRFEIEIAAFPELSKLAVPKTVEPLLNVTVPVGTALPEAGVTVVVNVTEAPNAIGLAEATMVEVVVISDWVTLTVVACVTALASKFAAPP